MGLESLASVGLTFAKNSQVQQNAKGQADAAVQEAGIQANNAARRTQLAVGSQTNRFLSSGIGLAGTAQADAAGTYATGLADVNQIVNNGNQQSKNIYSQARATMLQNIAGQAKGLNFDSLQKSAAGLFDPGTALNPITWNQAPVIGSPEDPINWNDVNNSGITQVQ